MVPSFITIAKSNQDNGLPSADPNHGPLVPTGDPSQVQGTAFWDIPREHELSLSIRGLCYEMYLASGARTLVMS